MTSATSARSGRTTSSACWRTRRSRTPAYLLVGVVRASASVGAEARGAARLLPGRVHRHDDRRVRRRGLDRQHATTSGSSSTTGPASRRAIRRAALAMTIFLLSLGGIPPTAGFFGKFYVFRAALETAGACCCWSSSPCSTASGQRLLLPAHRHRDVLPRGRPRGDAAARHRRVGGADRRRHRRARSSASCRPGSSTWPTPPTSPSKRRSLFSCAASS